MFAFLVNVLDVSLLQEAPKATQLRTPMNSVSQAIIEPSKMSDDTTKIQLTPSSETKNLCHSQNPILNAEYRINQSKLLDRNKRKVKSKKRAMDLAKDGHHLINQSGMIVFAIFYLFFCLANECHASENQSFDEKNIQKNHPSVNFLTRSKRDSHIGGERSEGM